jgi:hypothetical protein
MRANGVATTTDTFSDIPTTASTTATFIVGAQATGPETISVDVDGNGSTTLITANEVSPADQNYRTSLFGLRALLASHKLNSALRAILIKSFKDFSGQLSPLKTPNPLLYLTFQALISTESGVKLAFPDINELARLFHALGF